MSRNVIADGLPLVRLPEPWKTCYQLEIISEDEKKNRVFRLVLAQRQNGGQTPPRQLHHETTTFKEPIESNSSRALSQHDNTAWAIAQRAPIVYLTWEGSVPPDVGQVWAIVYAIVSLRPELELFRLSLSGESDVLVSEELQSVGIAVDHPAPCPRPGLPTHDAKLSNGQLVVSRATFWQGAGSPFGSRPVWVASPTLHGAQRRSVCDFPIRPLQQTMTTGFPETTVHAFHPVRLTKPAPGELIYSRYIPHLDEFFSMDLLDYTNDEHLRLFNKWQNDPRVAKGWNETGTLEQHRDYLRRIHEDPHQMAVLAKFNDVYFAYFEIYWAKEDHLGAYYDAGDYDRGRHSLVGDVQFRGAHRVMAWWSSLMHYIFLDDPRTEYVVGEPKYTNATVLAYDFAHGFNVEKLVDLPHKRSAFVRCPRAKFFQLSSFSFSANDEKLVRQGNPDRALKL